MKSNNGKLYVASVFACLLVLGGCSAKIEAVGGDTSQPNRLLPDNNLLNQLQGMWRTACENRGKQSRQTELRINGSAVEIASADYQKPDCAGGSIESMTEASLVVGAASSVVAGAYDVDFAIGGGNMLNIARLDGDTLYLGLGEIIDGARLFSRPTELAMERPYTRVR